MKNLYLLAAIIISLQLFSCQSSNPIESKIHKNWVSKKITSTNAGLKSMGVNFSNSKTFDSFSIKDGLRTQFKGNYKIEGDSIEMNFESYISENQTTKTDTLYSKKYRIQNLNDSAFHLTLKQFDVLFVEKK